MLFQLQITGRTNQQPATNNLVTSNQQNKKMKLITAIIREKQLDIVREALIAAEITRITVSRVSGHGQQKQEEIYRGRVFTPGLLPKVKIEIAVNDELLILL